MLELGDSSKADHEAAGIQALNSSADLLIFAGDEMKSAYEKVISDEKFKSSEKTVKYFSGHSDETVQEICNAVTDFAQPGDIILIKASRGMGLERITEKLEGNK